VLAPSSNRAVHLAAMLLNTLPFLFGFHVTDAFGVVPVGINEDADVTDMRELDRAVEELERENAVEFDSAGPAVQEDGTRETKPHQSRGHVVPIQPRRGPSESVREKKPVSSDDSVEANGTSKDELFPASGLVARKVRFWELVFQNYPSTTMIIHDVDEPDRIVDLIDFQGVSRGRAGEAVAGRAERQRVAQRYVARYELALQRFQQLGESALQFGAIERRIWSTYGSDGAQRNKLIAGDIRIRSQSGLADTFSEAARSAQKYLPYMERVFSKQGLPVELTRLPFVESMFNSEARSRVGASGMWQFMPGTAKLYMRVDGRMVDERNSPWKATRAAAQLMQDNYSALRSWPLAVTAYNHGAAGMERAMRETGSSEFNDILAGYRSKSFGFASRNFYAEFLAAVRSYDVWKKKGSKPGRPGDHSLEFVSLPRKASVAEIISAARIPERRLAELNPCLLPGAFTKHRKKPLPPGFELRLPKDHARKLRLAMGGSRSNEGVSRR
jgi:membrane-bound lytic murein transglycosylase D